MTPTALKRPRLSRSSSAGNGRNQPKSGALPVNLKFVEERTVLAQLGADSIRAGITASVIAVVAIVLFMLVTYGRFGIYANIAVILNVFVILAVMALFHSTLTLPGIAGFVLTIGTAVDANVLINERIREERRRGRNVIQASRRSSWAIRRPAEPSSKPI